MARCLCLLISHFYLIIPDCHGTEERFHVPVKISRVARASSSG